jgi:hypothetical protein
MSGDIRQRAVLSPKERRFEDFRVGQTFRHYWGRTISESDTLHFSTLMLALLGNEDTREGTVPWS